MSPDEHITDDFSESVRLEKMNISGMSDTAISFSDLRIVRIDSLGDEKNFSWIINGLEYRPDKGDILLFSCIDLRLPVVSKTPSDVRITVLNLPRDVFFEDPEYIGLFYSDKPEHKLIRAGTIPPAEQEFAAAENELTRPDGIRRAAVFHAKLLLIELCRALCTDSDFRSPHIGEITSYICRNFTKRISITDTAREIGVSVSLLSKEMNRDLGVSFPEYVRRLRVNNVLSLLSGRKMNVTEAAFASGFSSMQGFYRAFHEITGKSPREMLKSGENSSDR